MIFHDYLCLFYSEFTFNLIYSNSLFSYNGFDLFDYYIRNFRLWIHIPTTNQSPDHYNASYCSCQGPENLYRTCSTRNIPTYYVYASIL